MSPSPQSMLRTIETGKDTTAKFIEILKANGISDEVSEVVVNDAGLIGEGMASLSKYVTVTFQNPDKPQLNLFMKTHSNNKSHTEAIDAAKAFEKEARFFLEYVPAAERLAKEKGHGDLVNIYPKCYYGDNNMTVLENLVLDKGFYLSDKEKQQDFEAASFAMKTLAKHHALSYAMIKKYGGPKTFFEKFPNLDFESFNTEFSKPMMGPMFETGLETNIKILEANDIEGKDEAILKLNSFKGKLYPLVMDIILNITWDKLVLLNHGDYWNNNMMFKKNESGKIIDHVAIDLQITRYNCPQVDLGYYMFTSLRPEVRRKYLKELLSLYLTTLKNVGKDLDCDITVTDEEFFEGFQKAFKFGYWFGTCVANGPGFAVLKEIDVNTIDISDWGNAFGKAVTEWIKRNPEKGLELAKDIVLLLKEYDDLSMD